LDHPAEKAAGYVGELLNGELSVTDQSDRERPETTHPGDNDGRGKPGADTTSGNEDPAGAVPEYVFCTSPRDGLFTTRYTWHVVDDPNGDGGPAIKQCRETTPGTVLAMLLPAVLV
jgi:hypothetical protein